MRNQKRGDIDADYHAIRARLKSLGSTTVVTAPLPPHGHAASAITFVPAGNLAGDDVQEVLEEIDIEKLARDGSQTMLGNLDMDHHDVNNIVNAEVEGDLNLTGAASDIHMFGANGASRIDGVRNLSFSGDVGEGIINQPRVIHMTGDNDDAEALIDGVERIVFNDEPTKSSIEQVSRIEYNIDVTAGTSYTAAEGRSSWDVLEDILIAYAASGAGVVAIALGWGVALAMNGYNPE